MKNSKITARRGFLSLLLIFGFLSQLVSMSSKASTDPNIPTTSAATGVEYVAIGYLENATRSNINLDVFLRSKTPTTDLVFITANVNGLGWFYYTSTKGWQKIENNLMSPVAYIDNSTYAPNTVGIYNGISPSYSGYNQTYPYYNGFIKIINGMDLSSPIFNQTRVYVSFRPYGAKQTAPEDNFLIFQIGGSNW